MNNAIDQEVGIWNTTATIVRHKNGDTTLRFGFVWWENNSGSLAFKKVRLTGATSLRCRSVFDGTATDSYEGKSWKVGINQFLSEI